MHKEKINSAALLVLILSAALLAGACGKKEEKKGRPPSPITVAQAAARNLQITQESVGHIDSETAPFVAAEVAGRVVKINVDVGQRVARGQALAELDVQDQTISRQGASAEANRLQALVANQERQVERYQKLVRENFVSQTMLETNESQLAALREQLLGAKAQLNAAERNLSKTRVVAPVSGRVEQRLIALGDYVMLGKPLFQLATAQNLRVHLPFPETAATQLRPGLPVRLTTPTAVKAVNGRITDIRPMINSESRAIDVIVDVPNPGDWRAGASVQGVVVVGERPKAIVVPELSVVARPAGEVVYVIDKNTAAQRTVRTGQRQEGLIEILSGLNVGETVAVDGAAFLTDKTAVTVKQPPAPTAAPIAAPASAAPGAGK